MKPSNIERSKKICELVRVIKDIRKVMRYYFIKKTKECNLNITIEMLDVLYILWERDHLSQQEIADKTNRNKASLTSIIDNMVARGLIIKHADPNDRRINLIALTKDSDIYQQKLLPILAGVYETFQADVSLQDLESTTEVLQKIYQRIAESENKLFLLK